MNPSDSTTSKKVVELNVRGKIVTVAQEVLCAVQASKLAQRFGLNQKDDGLQDSSGRPFIDINPRVFAHVVHLLRQVHRRSTTLTFRPKSLGQTEKVFLVLSELGLDRLVDKTWARPSFRFDAHLKGPDIALSPDGLVAERIATTSGGHQYAKAEQGLAHGRVAWRVLVQKPCGRYWVGVATLAGELSYTSDKPRTWLLGSDPGGSPNMITDGVRAPPSVSYTLHQGDVIEVQLDLTKPHARTITFIINGALAIPMKIADDSSVLYPTVMLAPGGAALLRFD